MGHLLLEGGAEFGGAMSEPDLAAIRLAGGPGTPIAILPTAAAPDRNHDRAGRNGSRWFRSLGASQVDVVPVIDRLSADDPALAGRLADSRLIYLLGGFPGHLAETLRGSLAWGGVLRAYAAGAVVGGSSAGAMVVCQHYYDPESAQVRPGLNLLANACVLPHHNGFGRSWAPDLAEALPGVTLIGVDERTGILGGSGRWTVHGGGQVTLYRAGVQTTFRSGDAFDLP